MTYIPPKIDPEILARCRRDNPEAAFLSDWQVYSANLVLFAISSKAFGMDTGPKYIPMPTGAGKTTGAIWGIVNVVQEFPEKRICFLTPYTASVDHVHAALVQKLGAALVGMYYSEAFESKQDALSKQVVVLTHQFVQYNKGALDDRDIFIVDEAIHSTGEASLTLVKFAEAQEWATKHNVLPREFEAANAFANDLYRKLQNSDDRFYAAENNKKYSWAVAISQLSLIDHYQTLVADNPLQDIKTFCEALLLGFVFLDRGQTTAKSYNPTFNAAVLGIPKLDNTIILSATGGLMYDIGEKITESSATKAYWTAPNYGKLKLVKLPDPLIGGHYRDWKSSQVKQKVVNYLEWLLGDIPEQEVYLTLPLQVIKNCLREYFDLGSDKDVLLPKVISKHGKTINLSHHALSIGSNKFKDCKAVIYLWDNHLPRNVPVKRVHTLSDEPVTEDTLLDANERTLKGPYARMRDAAYVDNIIQQMGRGSMRQISADGHIGEMSAYLLVRPNDFLRLPVVMRGCMVEEKTGYGTTQTTSSRIGKIIEYLTQQATGQDIPASDVQAATGVEIKKVKGQLQGDWDIVTLGYQFDAGSKGRGKGAIFKWVG